MSGWAGGAANYRWQRGRRGPDDGRLGLREDVARILAQFRESHDWEPGMTWNPYRAAYERAQEEVTVNATATRDSRYEHYDP